MPDGRPYYRLHQQLIGLRRRHPWLVRARTTITALTDESVAYTAGDGVSRLAVALNLAGHPARLTLPTGAWRPVAGSGELGQDTVALPPCGWATAS